MKSAWSDDGAGDAIRQWGGAPGEDFALRLYTARLIGRNPDLVLHGGGNVSFKNRATTLLGDKIETLHVKASGADMAALEPSAMPALELAPLRRLRALDALDDEEMVNQFRKCLLDTSAPTPSIETLVHALLPHRYVDHSHADAVLAVTNQPDGAAAAREAMGCDVAVLGYVRPGFDLAKAIMGLFERRSDVEGIVLLHHGLITFGDDARTAYERHIDLVDRCEAFLGRRAAGRTLTSRFQTEQSPAELVVRVAPLLRGLLARSTGDEDQPHARLVAEWRAGDAVLAFVNSKEALTLSTAGPLTGDHLIRTRSRPLFISEPDYGDENTLGRQLRDAIDAYATDYTAYCRAQGGSTDDLDAKPRVVMLPGLGLLGWGPSKADACIAADIAEHTFTTQVKAHFAGGYRALSDEHLYAMEFRGLQRRKLARAERRPLEGQVVVISGGAGAIGRAIAEGCASAGAHVAVADLDENRIAKVVTVVEQRHGPGRAVGMTMDVTDEDSVRAGFEEVVRTFGGVDVVVPNAGIAHVAAIDELAVEDFRRVLEVNAVGYLLFIREGVRILKRQGLGGHVIINASKNVFGPGKDFGAYSASKAAGHQLGKVAAIELAPFNIRVNMINADAVFGDADTPSGLWAEVGPERAKSRGMEPADLPEYYRGRNLLKARVCGRHVANAVIFFASNATPTTGATLPVDGGVVEAFPR